MIRALVDFALKNRWLVLGGVVVMTAWGVISFRNLPIEAYPDVANNYVQIITQWPGRSAEEIERQVTVPSRDSNGRYPSSDPSAFHHSGRALEPHADLRRQLYQRRKPRACIGTPEPGQSSRQILCRRWEPIGALWAKSIGTRSRAPILHTT